MPTVRTLIPQSFSRTDTATYTLDDIRKEVNEICIWLDYIWGHEKQMQKVQFYLQWNEKPRWKYKANYVSNFTEFKVTRCVNPEDAPAWYAQETAARLGGAKYQVYCPNCNRVIATRSRMCKLIEYPHLYRCGKCYNNKLEVRTLF